MARSMGQRPSAREQVAFDSRDVFAAFLLLHIAVWTALPLLFTSALPVDTIEGVIWGQGWQLSYIHPPLQAWLLGTLDALTGNQRWAISLASQLLVATGLWAVWSLARLIVTPLGALVSVLTLEGVLFFNFMTPNLFPDLVELPFWALATRSLYRALRFGRLGEWAFLGLWLAAAAYAKYTGAVLAVVMIAFMLAEPLARRCWRTKGPYVSAALCILLLSPHLWWISKHGFPTVQRFDDSARAAGGLIDRLDAVAGFTSGELALVALAGVLILVLRWSRRSSEAAVPLAGAPSRFDRRFVAAMALGPILVTWVAAAASGLWFRVHWGYAMWSLLGLIAVVFIVPGVDQAALRRFGRAWAASFLLVAMLYAGVNALAPYARASVAGHLLARYDKESSFPSRELAQAITRGWREKVGQPLAFVIGSKWLGGHVGMFSPDRPQVLRDGDPTASPWIDIDEVRRQGAVVVWDPSQDLKPKGRYRGWLAGSAPKDRFPTMEVQPPIVLPWTTRASPPPLRVMWGIIYPRADQAGRG